MGQVQMRTQLQLAAMTEPAMGKARRRHPTRQSLVRETADAGVAEGAAAGVARAVAVVGTTQQKTQAASGVMAGTASALLHCCELLWPCRPTHHPPGVQWRRMWCHLTRRWGWWKCLDSTPPAVASCPARVSNSAIGAGEVSATARSLLWDDGIRTPLGEAAPAPAPVHGAAAQMDPLVRFVWQLGQVPRSFVATSSSARRVLVPDCARVGVLRQAQQAQQTRQRADEEAGSVSHEGGEMKTERWRP